MGVMGAQVCGTGLNYCIELHFVERNYSIILSGDRQG
jgi:hypothetical protein